MGKLIVISAPSGAGKTSIVHYLLENMNVYPNPTLGKLHIDSQEKINTISISNILGKQMLFIKDFSANTIHFSSLDNGVYFINIRTDKGIRIEKIILSK